MGIAAESAKFYLDREKNGFSKYSAQVGLLLAQTYDERGEINDAIAMYVKVWGAHMGFVKISAPAMKRWMELSSSNSSARWVLSRTMLCTQKNEA